MGRYRWLFLVPQPTLCSSRHGSFLGDGSDAGTTGDQTLAISRLDLVPFCQLPVLFLGPQLVAGGETEAGQASGLPQGPRNPAGGSLSLTRGTYPVGQDWPCAQYALPPGKARILWACRLRQPGPAHSLGGGGAFAAISAGAGPSGARAGSLWGDSLRPPWAPVVPQSCSFSNALTWPEVGRQGDYPA